MRDGCNGKVCVITINYNDRVGLRNTIDSVRAQTCRDFEYIVVDGGSTDGSREVILENTDIIDQWVSEPDKGIYNAMNKGVQLYSTSGGEGYIIFMNSGDCFCDPHVIRRFYESNPTADVIAGGWVGHVENGPNGHWHAPRRADLYTMIVSTIPHTSTFVKAHWLRELPFREDFRIVSDWIFFWEALLVHKATYSRLDFDVCLADLNGISCTQPDLSEKERERYVSELMPIYVYEQLCEDLRYTKYFAYTTVGSTRLYTLMIYLYKATHRVCLWLMARFKKK